LDPAGIDKYNKKIMIAAIRDPDLFRVRNQFTHDMDIKRLGINPLVKRCGINPALWFLVMLIMMSKISSRTGINPGFYIIYIDFSIVFVISVRIESRGNELALNVKNRPGKMKAPGNTR
jgi:hypothetical protein